MDFNGGVRYFKIRKNIAGDSAPDDEQTINRDNYGKRVGPRTVDQDNGNSGTLRMHASRIFGCLRKQCRGRTDICPAALL